MPSTRYKHRSFFLLTVLLWSVPAAASDKVDQFIEAEMQRQHIPGVSLAVVAKGKPVKVRGYGFANLEHRVAATPETIYQSGSMGKQFTAMLILILAEEGKLSLDDRLGKFFKDAPPAWNEMSIRQVLSHTAGLGEYDLDMRREYTRDEVIRHCAKVESLSPPGTQWSYSNMGFMLLGFVAEQVEGKSYHQLVQDRIFKPLGMKTARGIEEADIIPNRAAGYVWRKDHLENQGWVTPTWNRTADGSLYFSIADLLVWENALREQKLVKAPAYQEMFTAQPLTRGKKAPYGLGFFVGEYGSRKVIQHSGHWQGFSDDIFRTADGALTVILLSNLASVNTPRFAREIAALYDASLGESRATDVKVSVDELNKYKGKYRFHRAASVTLQVVDGKLTAKVEGQMMSASDQTFPLTATGPGTFSNSEHNWDVSFRKDQSGKITTLLLGFYGGVVEAERVGQ